MNTRQFEYILAVDKFLSFGLAAEHCYITQSTLSTMVGRFEGEMGIQLFDRRKKPIKPTKEGRLIIDQIKRIQEEINALQDLSQICKGIHTGHVSIGVIPTIAPYLLPKIVGPFSRKFPNITFEISELTTHEITKSILNRDLDIGILAVPLQMAYIQEESLYLEPFVLYDSQQEFNDPILENQIDVNRLWLLSEGHCLRTQVQTLCDIRNSQNSYPYNVNLKTGSISNLMHFVKQNKGVTILPYLSTLELSEEDKNNVYNFKSDQTPVRNIGLIHHDHFVKLELVKTLKHQIQSIINPIIPNMESSEILSPI